MRLADLTTLGVGGEPDVLRTCTATNELIERLRVLDDARERVLILGGGSNILMGDGPFHGTVLQVATRGIEIEAGDGVVRLTVAAGEPWDALVELCVVNGWSGIEALSGIPGLVGATPIQNVGAYGQEISQVIESVRVLDRASGSVEVFDNAECLFEYRSSIFKRHPNRWLIVAVTIELRDAGQCTVRYGELATALAVEVGGVAAPGAVRSAVLALRAAKGMVLDVADADSRSAGSFFTNPIVIIRKHHFVDKVFGFFKSVKRIQLRNHTIKIFVAIVKKMLYKTNSIVQSNSDRFCCHLIKCV